MLRSVAIAGIVLVQINAAIAKPLSAADAAEFREGMFQKCQVRDNNKEMTVAQRNKHCECSAIGQTAIMTQELLDTDDEWPDAVVAQLRSIDASCRASSQK